MRDNAEFSIHLQHSFTIVEQHVEQNIEQHSFTYVSTVHAYVRMCQQNHLT